MSLSRTLYNYTTAIPRWWHRHGFGIQSPTDYELVRDVLFENLHYYAYEKQELRTEAERQLYRIKLWKPEVIVIHSSDEYHEAEKNADSETVMVIEDISGKNETLWQYVLESPTARVTFDMQHRGLVLFDTKRIKQNYIL